MNFYIFLLIGVNIISQEFDFNCFSNERQVNIIGEIKIIEDHIYYDVLLSNDSNKAMLIPFDKFSVNFEDDYLSLFIINNLHYHHFRPNGKFKFYYLPPNGSLRIKKSEKISRSANVIEYEREVNVSKLELNISFNYLEDLKKEGISFCKMNNKVSNEIEIKLNRKSIDYFKKYNSRSISVSYMQNDNEETCSCI